MSTVETDRPSDAVTAADEPAPFEPREGVPDVLVTAEQVQHYAGLLQQGTGPLAVDAERASGFRYSQRAYLVQLRRAGAGTALIDPVAAGTLASIAEATTGVEWILHAATQDLPCLAELGMRPDLLFDTELAGRLLGRERVSLSALVRSELGEVLEKGHGAADWSARPLSAAQLRYAALDVELLPELRDALESALREAGKWEMAQQEFEALVHFEPRPRAEEPWRRTSGIHKLRSPRMLAVVRALWEQRDGLAQRQDVAPGRLLPDASIIIAAQSNPASIDALLDTKGFVGRGAARYARLWWEAITSARALPDSELPAGSPPPSGPPPPKAWADRNPPAWARLSAARTALAERAEALGMPVENVMTPDLVRRLCWEPPAEISAAAVAAELTAAGARSWQVDATVDSLVEALLADVLVTDE